MPALTVYLSPQGKLLTQETVVRFAACPRLLVVAGRYEGVDERLIETEIDEEWSIGDYIVSGGELPALVVFDAVVRLLPGVLGHAESAVHESHMSGLLDCPHYTRPEEIAAGGCRRFCNRGPRRHPALALKALVGAYLAQAAGSPCQAAPR